MSAGRLGGSSPHRHKDDLDNILRIWASHGSLLSSAPPLLALLVYNYTDRVLCCFNLHHTQSKCPRKFLERSAPTRLTSVLVIRSIILLSPLYTLYAPSYSHYIPSMHPVCTLYISCMCLVGSLSMHFVRTFYIPSMYPLWFMFSCRLKRSSSWHGIRAVCFLYAYTDIDVHLFLLQ